MAPAYQIPLSNPNSTAPSLLRPAYQSETSQPNSPAVSILRPTYQGSSSLSNSPAAPVLYPAHHSLPSHHDSPVHSVLHLGLQSTYSHQYHFTTFQMLQLAAAEVLQRVEAQSAVDVESYVRALGDKRYAVVKESRRAALLRRARTESEAAELDDATTRRITNLASAEASRAKKEFIMDELHSQLKKKSDDAVVLANELRRILAVLEQAGNENRQLEVQLHQQRLGYDPFLSTPTQLNGRILNVAPTVQDTTHRFFSKENLPPSADQFFSGSGTSMEEDHDQSQYSSAMDQCRFQDGTPATPGTVITTTTDCGLSPEQRQAQEAFSSV